MKSFKVYMDLERDEDMLPQNVPLWHEDYSDKTLSWKQLRINRFRIDLLKSKAQISLFDSVTHSLLYLRGVILSSKKDSH